MNLIKRRLNYIKKIICLYISMLFKKDENLFVFGSWFGDKFADNAKYLYLYFLKNKMNAVWITKNPDVYKQLVNENMPVAMAYSKEGRNYCRRAKYIFVCTGKNDLNENWIGGSICIDLQHGVPLKKVMYDDEVNKILFTKSNKIHAIITKIPLGKYYAVSSSETLTNIFMSALRVRKDQILQFGLPRNDGFFDGSLSKKKYSDIPYSKLIAYMPTHRNTGKTKIDIESLFDLEKLNQFCVEKDILFVIKKHFYHNAEVTDVSDFSNIIDLTGQQVDTQELLYNTDILISDYSGVFIDYILLDRPILFYAYDYDHYLANDRNLYFKYEDTAPGFIVSNFDEFYGRLGEIVEGGYKVLDKHFLVKNVFFDKENQGIVSQKYLDFVRECNRQ